MVAPDLVSIPSAPYLCREMVFCTAETTVPTIAELPAALNANVTASLGSYGRKGVIRDISA